VKPPKKPRSKATDMGVVDSGGEELRQRGRPEVKATPTCGPQAVRHS
jgi:hypothetical protein